MVSELPLYDSSSSKLVPDDQISITLSSMTPSLSYLTMRPCPCTILLAIARICDQEFLSHPVSRFTLPAFPVIRLYLLLERHNTSCRKVSSSPLDGTARWKYSEYTVGKKLATRLELSITRCCLTAMKIISSLSWERTMWSWLFCLEPHLVQFYVTTQDLRGLMQTRIGSNGQLWEHNQIFLISTQLSARDYMVTSWLMNY